MDSVNQLKLQYKGLVGDTDFDTLELNLGRPNIFEVLRITKSEIRHTNFLGWLLDPNESHGLNDLLLKRFLRDIFSNEISTSVSEFDVELLELHKIEVRREWKNIDLLLLFNDLVICIENKVYSKEHSDQLRRYKTIVEAEFPNHRKVFVYLTLFGETSENDDQAYINYSHASLVHVLHNIANVFHDKIPVAVQTYLNDYIVSLKRNFMKNEKVNDLAKQIYSNHKEILDFIFDNKPDFAEDLRQIIEAEVVEKGWILGSPNKGYVRFLPDELNGLIPKGLSIGWPFREAFLFEIDFYWYPKKLKLQTVVSPSDHGIHALLNKILGKVEGAKRPQGKKWLKHFMIDKDFDKSKLQEQTRDEIRPIIKNYLNDFASTVKLVTDEILKHTEEIKSLK